MFFSIAQSSRTDVLKLFMPGVSFWLIFLLSFIQHVLFAVSWMYSEYCMLSLQHNKRYTKVGLLGRWRQTTLTILRSPLALLTESSGTLGQGWGFFAYDYSSHQSHEVVLPLKMGNHLYFPIRQMKRGYGKRRKNIDITIKIKLHQSRCKTLSQWSERHQLAS